MSLKVSSFTFDERRSSLPQQVPLSVLCRIRPSTPQQRFATRLEWPIEVDDGDVLFGPRGPEARGSEPLHGCVLGPRAVVRTLSH